MLSRTIGRREKGQAVVEFALAAPFLLMFVFFIADVGFLAYSHISVTSAVREGARCAAVGGTEAAVSARVEQASGGLANFTGIESIDWDPDPAEIGGEVTVTASYSYDWITPVGLVPGLSGTLDFTREAVMRMETDDVDEATC
jgi:Flp pilus assembly protein TadG